MKILVYGRFMVELYGNKYIYIAKEYNFWKVV